MVLNPYAIVSFNTHNRYIPSEEYSWPDKDFDYSGAEQGFCQLRPHIYNCSSHTHFVDVYVYSK